MSCFYLVSGRAFAAPGDAIYTQPGQIVSVDGRNINFYCLGSGGPTVILDAGFEDWSPAWAVVHPRIAKFARACTWDRPGSGFSDPGLMPRTSVRIAQDLHAALHAGNIPGPYILVGHSFGSYNIRSFLDLYPNEVAGMVIVDGEAGDVEPAAAQRDDDQFVGPTVAMFKRCRTAIVNNDSLPMEHYPGSKQTFVCNKVFFRQMPDPAFSATLNRYIERVSLTQIPLWDQIISEMTEMPGDEQYLKTHIHSLGNKPVYVLTAMHHFGDTQHMTAKERADAEQFEQMNARAAAQWLKLSSNSIQWFAPKSGHYIEIEAPDLVVRAVKGAVRQLNER